MGRIFSLLTVVAVLMILFVASCAYWLSSASIAQAKQDSATAVVNAVALSLSQQVDLLSRTLNKMAQDPEVLIAATRADPVLLTTVAARFEKYFPDALKLRLLLPGVSEIDEKSTPRMGFADLDMVRETFTNNQPPEIQGYEGVDRHLAITARIMEGGRVAGVILASLDYGFFNKIVQTAAIQGGTIELKQANLVLSASGKRDAGQGQSVQTKVANTNWEVHCYYAAGADLFEMTLITSILVVSVLLVMLAFLFGYRRLSGLLEQDLDTVLNACKDMMTNKQHGSYPVNLTETTAVIVPLMQFKRTLDQYNKSDGVDLELNRVARVDLSKPVLEENQFIDLSTDAGVVIREPKITAKDNPKIIAMDDETSAIFRAYDICGVVSKTLTKEIAYDIGRALGTDAKDYGCKTIVVGRDGRTSSPMLAEALAQGIVSTGRNVLNIGMVPMPMLYFVAQHTEGRSGIMITGGHSPVDYNGMKMMVNGETLAGERIQHIRQCIISQLYARDENGTIENNDKYTSEYIGTVSDDIHIARPMLVVLDCGNGVAGKLGPELLQTLGCEVVELFCDIDGTFPNHNPDPSNPENLAELIASVKHYKADLGIAFDGDGSRVGIVDSNGKIIWPDRQMMLFAKDVLAKKPGAEIIYDVECTGHLAKQITKYGGKPVMWKTGHSLMKARLKETGAALAGGMSGHIFFNDRWFGFDDALYSAARLIEILSRVPQSSAEIFAQFPDAINTPEWNIRLEEGEHISFMESLFAKAIFVDGKITAIDGMRVDFSNGWGLVRASSTTPSLVIRFEADSKEALLTIQNQFKQLMKEVKPGIVLPF